MTTAQFHSRDFSEVLSDVRAETGILALRNLASNVRVCLHLSNEKVQAVFVNGRPMRCAQEARCMLIEQFSQPTKTIQFEAAEQADLRKGLSICVDELLADAPEDCGCKAKGFLQKMWRRFARG